MKSQTKFSMSIRPDPDDAELLFAKQLGIPCAYTWVSPEQTGYEYLVRLRERVENAGLTLHNVGSMSVGKSDAIHLALPGRDEKIAEFQQFVRNLGRAGIGVTTFTWEPDAVWSSPERGETRGASARRVDLAEMVQRPPTHGRAYSREELWENFAYFMERIIPVCEEAGVRLALHPNDPPTTESLGGIPCLIHSWETYERAFEIANSPALGMEFCCGCWLEGGTEGFGDILAAIRHFVAEDRILLVHFRNITSPLPVFTETFLDNGYMDMYQIMKTFVETGYSNTMILDHTPRFVEGNASLRRAGDGVCDRVYAFALLQCAVERAEAELGAD